MISNTKEKTELPVSIETIKSDLAFCENHSVVLFGSIVQGDFIPKRSDIDIAIVSFSKDKKSNLKLWKNLIGKVSPQYDIRIFELFPLYIQIDIIRNYQVIFGDHLDLSEHKHYYQSY